MRVPLEPPAVASLLTSAKRTSAWLRVAVVLPRMALHIVAALLIIACFRRFAPASTPRLIRWWSGRLLAICGLRLRVVDPTRDSDSPAALALRPGGGAMLVLNHVSWADIFVVHAVRPARFVAKAEIAGWPLFGYLTRHSGAIFIERGKRHRVREANLRAAQGLAAGDLVCLFPEGTVSDGRRLLPFHANLIQSAIRAHVPIVVAGIRYLDPRGRPAAAMDFTGDVTMLQSLIRIARHGPIDVELHLIDVLDGAANTRHAVARAARTLIAARFGYDEDDEANEAGEAADAWSAVVVADDAGVTRDDALPGRPPGTPPDPRDELP